jgi:hypothetical protein
MNLIEKYKEDYILLAGLRQYIEEGTILATVNFWRDSAQEFKEFEVIEHRSSIFENNPLYSNNLFLKTFIAEEFPLVEDRIPQEIINLVLPIIEEKEGKETLLLLKELLIEYAICIAKASKEDWLAFLAIKDSISDSEEAFIEKIRTLLDK